MPPFLPTAADNDSIPFVCSAAFFHGQVEQPVRLMSLVHHKDIPVVIAVNEKGVFVIDHVENVRN